MTSLIRREVVAEADAQQSDTKTGQWGERGHTVVRRRVISGLVVEIIASLRIFRGYKQQPVAISHWRDPSALLTNGDLHVFTNDPLRPEFAPYSSLIVNTQTMKK